MLLALLVVVYHSLSLSLECPFRSAESSVTVRSCISVATAGNCWRRRPTRTGTTTCARHTHPVSGPVLRVQRKAHSLVVAHASGRRPLARRCGEDVAALLLGTTLVSPRSLGLALAGVVVQVPVGLGRLEPAVLLCVFVLDALLVRVPALIDHYVVVILVDATLACGSVRRRRRICGRFGALGGVWLGVRVDTRLGACRALTLWLARRGRLGLGFGFCLSFTLGIVLGSTGSVPPGSCQLM